MGRHFSRLLVHKRAGNLRITTRPIQAVFRHTRAASRGTEIHSPVHLGAGVGESVEGDEDTLECATAVATVSEIVRDQVRGGDGSSALVELLR